MSAPTKYSIIVPVYNRPQEVDELLASLASQVFRNFEVIIVEDGSSIRCDTIVNQYKDELAVRYFYRPNTGPGPSRNFGYEQAWGEYFVVFDSDCIIPTSYFQAVEKSLQENHWDAWGGPDRAHATFTLLQRAMGYTMASFLTTGGIRGGKKGLGWFQPRSFNMGISREVYENTKGFMLERFAEDIEFSIRMKKAGFNVGLIPDAFVYHKRRTTFRQFYNQVYNFGKGRVLVGILHPEEVKLTHWFPTVFTLGMITMPFLPLIDNSLFTVACLAYGLYMLAIFVHSVAVNGNLVVALLSIPSALIQLVGYGTGFFMQWVKSYIT